MPVGNGPGSKPGIHTLTILLARLPPDLLALTDAALTVPEICSCLGQLCHLSPNWETLESERRH